jgi:O-antigen/teichoic acid export membrane protein
MPSRPDHPETNRVFQTTDLRADLGRRSVGGGAVTMAAQAVKFVLALGSTAILARLLSREDFGLIAGVLAFIGLADRFKDLGLPMSTVQREEISHAQVSTLFWINAGLAGALAALAAGAAPAVAWFYEEPAMIAVTVALATTILAGGLTVQHQALLRRGMRFARLAGLEVAALLLGATAAVVAAAAGAAYWSLVVMQVVVALINLAGVWLLCPWRPGRPVRGSGVRPMLVFGGYLSGKGLLQYASKSLDKMLVGRYCGADSLGIYSKAWQLLLLPVQQLSLPLTGVAVSTLSRLQHDPARYRAFLHAGVQVLVFFSMPLVVILFVAAEELVLAVLGPAWMDVVPVYRVLAPAALMSTFNAATGWVYISWGHTRRQFRWVAFSSVLQMLAFLAGLPWGTIGVAAAFSIAVVILRLPGLAYCFKGTPLRVAPFLAVIGRPAAASVVAGGLLYLGRLALFPHAPLAGRLLLDATTFAVVYPAVWLLLPGGRRILKDIMALVPLVVGMKTPGKSDR